MNHTFSLRLSKYIADWVTTKYGCADKRNAPITMPTAHPVGKIIYRYLKSNPTFQRWSNKCYCEMMANRRPYELPDDMNRNLPKEERDVFVRFNIPESHYYDGRLIQCDDTMQLEIQSVTEVSDFLKEEFWNDFEDYAETYFRRQSIITDYTKRLHKEFDVLNSKHVPESEEEAKEVELERLQDKIERCYNVRKKPDAWYMILDFCDFWHIHNDATDAIYRQMHRLIKQEKIQVVNSPRRRRKAHPNPPHLLPTGKMERG